MLSGLRALCVLFCAFISLPRVSYAQEHVQDVSQKTIEFIEDIANAYGAQEALRRLDGFISALPPEDRAVAWKVPSEEPIDVRHAWRSGKTICFQNSSSDAIYIVNARTGEIHDAVILEKSRRGDAEWVTSTKKEGEILVASRNGILLADTRSGEFREILRCPVDPRIAPVMFHADFIILKGYRSSELARIDRAGKSVWNCQLPGYVMSHPAVYGPTMVVQICKSSYGGQATLAVNLNTGKQLWCETTNANGWGAAFGNDAIFVVEADQWLSAGDAEAWLICRNPTTGKRLWEYRRPGHITHRPLVDQRSNHVFVVFSTGAVVCFKGKDGTILWETHLPAEPAQAPSPYHHPYWPALGLYDDYLMVLDHDDQLHFLDVKDGKSVTSFALTSPLSPDGRRNGYDHVVAMPWIEGKNLIVASARGITAYPLGHVFSSREAPELLYRSCKVKLLLHQGRIDDAAAEVAEMQALRAPSPITLEAVANLCQVRNDTEGEVIARLRLMRRKGLSKDERLQELVGLRNYVYCGPNPTPPLLVGDKIFVGSSDGYLRAYSTPDLSSMDKLDVKTGITSQLPLFDNVIVFPTDNRHVCGVSQKLQLLFDWSASNPLSLYLTLNGKLICSSLYLGFSDVGVLDLEKQGFGPMVRINCVANTPVIYKGRLYYPNVGGGSTSYDGASTQTHPARMEVDQYRVNPSGDYPVAYGTGGVYEVDEEVRPIKLLVASPRAVFAAAVNNGVIAAFSQGTKSSDPWLLEAWKESGEKLPLTYATQRYNPQLAYAPILIRFEKGFLFIGREIVYVEHSREKAVWRFWPGGFQGEVYPEFREPVVHGDYVYITHKSGDLYVFSKSKILQTDSPEKSVKNE
jgi:outer membrane protein assembly factor BamB